MKNTSIHLSNLGFVTGFHNSLGRLYNQFTYHRDAFLGRSPDSHTEASEYVSSFPLFRRLTLPK